MINKPVTLFFEPLSLDVKFQKCLKLQIAIFRLSAEEAKGNKRAVKMDKTDPVKFTNPQEKITFNKMLSLLTTLPFNSETQCFQSKEVDFEMALEIDGKKERMGKKINIREILLGKNKPNKFAQENPMISLLFRAEVKIQDEKNTVEPPKRADQPKKTKLLRFDDDVPNTKQNVKQPKEQQYDQTRPQRVEKGRYKTVFFEPPQPEAKIQDNHSQENQNKVMKKYKSLDKGNKINETQEKQTKIDSRANFDFESKIEQYKDKYSKLESKYAILQKATQDFQKKIKQKDLKLVQLTHRNEELQQKIMSQMKNYKKQKDQLRKQQSSKAINDNQIITQLKEEIKSYQSQIQKLRKTALSFQESTKHIANGSQHEIRSLKQKISNLEKVNLESSRELQVFQQSLKNKDEIITDLKTKIYALDKENLECQNKIKSLQVKIQKNKEQYEQQVEQLQNKINQMKEDSKNFKIATLKDIKDDNTVDYKKKVQMLQKQLQKKEELLRKMTDMKKQNENQRNNQISNLKKEVASLKEVIDKLESSKTHHGSESSDIQIKIQLQKLKKEVETCRKNEKTLLIQKGKLQASNRSLQDDIVKNKCAIANILNAVQQTGNQKLITEVYCLTQ